MIRLRLNKDFHSPQSGEVLYRRGWQNVSDSVGKMLVTKGYVVVEENAEGQQEPSGEAEENVGEDSFREETESPEDNKFACCGNDWKNQGRLNFHRRSRACPQSTTKK